MPRLERSELGKLTKYGENRIKNCQKYDLGGGCRLVTVQKDACIILLYVGSHEETDKWLESKKGLEFLDKNSHKIHAIFEQRDGFTHSLPQITHGGKIFAEKLCIFLSLKNGYLKKNSKEIFYP